MNDRLWDAYEQVCTVELRPVTELVDRLRAGEFGAVPRGEVVALLRQLEENVLTSVRRKGEEHPAYAERVDEVAEEQRRLFEDLVAAVEADWPWP